MIQGRFISVVTSVAILIFSVAGAAAEELQAVPGEFLVQVKSTARFSGSQLKQIANAEKLEIVSRNMRVMLVKTNLLVKPEFALAELQKNSAFEIVEPNYIYRINRTSNDPKMGELWGLLNLGQKDGRLGVDVGAEEAWDVQTGSDKVVVAIIDSGVDYNHIDIRSNAWTNAREATGRKGVDDDGNGYIDDIHGYDFANNDGDSMDDNGHGTHCAGTIGARGNDGVGLVGVAWNVKLMGLKFLNGDGSGPLNAALKAVEYAIAQKVDIMNNSWGGGPYSKLLENAIKTAEQKGILFVASAGNENNNNDINPSYPASYQAPNVVAVAAIDRIGNLATFKIHEGVKYGSNYGRKTVHIAAPGKEILSSVPGGYATFQGTSMAAPHVSGVAALLKAQFPWMNAVQLKERLMKSSLPLAGLRATTISGGAVNARYALLGIKAPIDPEDPFNWASAAKTYSTAHPYANPSIQKMTIHQPGAKRLAVYFSRFQTEKDFDVVRFKDSAGNILEEWSGNNDEMFSPVVLGDTLIIEFQSDDNIEKYGFDITKVAYQ